MWRAAPPWVVAMLVGACATTAALVLFSAACAQPTGSADLSVTKTRKPRVVTGENQIFTIRVPERAHRENSARIGHATRITPANKHALREQAFALHAQGLSQVQIAARLGVNKNTAQKYIRD